MVSFGETLRAAREGRGLTLREVARKLAVDVSYLSRLERGTLHPPRDERILQIASAVGMSPTRLFAAAALDRPHTFASRTVKVEEPRRPKRRQR